MLVTRDRKQRKYWTGCLFIYWLLVIGNEGKLALLSIYSSCS